MGYLSLYREFRPRTFDEVVGQAHITVTLINQIKTGRIGHAYLFTGSRGVGKTTCARIFARAINCQNSSATGQPCYKCDTCKKLENASNLDITEIDAASNNGVDDARELRDRIKYPPVSGKYKVFIIDEVHMLTGSAFNALLKTIEEPPPHVVFILATTESYKLPATILSRVMRFDFRLLPNIQIQQIVASAYQKSGKKFQPEAISYIASLAEGSPRDALSIADRCLSVSEGELTYDDVLSLLGAANQAQINQLTKTLIDGQIGAALNSVDKLIKSGKSVGMIAKDILSHTRDLLIAKAAPDILELPAAQKQQLADAAMQYSTELLASLIQIFSAIDADLRYSVAPRTILETACVRACKLAITDLSALEERIQRLEKHLSSFAKLAQPQAQFPNGQQPQSPQQSQPQAQRQQANHQAIQTKSDFVNDIQKSEKNNLTLTKPTPQSINYAIQPNNSQMGVDAIQTPKAMQMGVDAGQVIKKAQAEPSQRLSQSAPELEPPPIPDWLPPDVNPDYYTRSQLQSTEAQSNLKKSKSANRDDLESGGKDFQPNLGQLQANQRQSQAQPANANAQASLETAGKSLQSSQGQQEDTVTQAQSTSMPLPSARSLWGRIITHIRTNSPQTIYAIVSEIGEVKLQANELKIVCGPDNYLPMTAAETQSELKKAVEALGYPTVTFSPMLVDEQADMDAQIQKIKALIGKAPLKIKE